MSCNLTDNQRKLVIDLVWGVRAKTIPEEFYVVWAASGAFIRYRGAPDLRPFTEITKAKLDAIDAEGLLRCKTTSDHLTSVTLTRKAYEAVDSNFSQTIVESLHLEPTLFGYWKAANWQQRARMISTFSFVFFLGFGVAQIPFLRDIFSVIKDLMP